eukprot:5745104-Pyramimonas_sp.AAC.1
MIFLPECFNYIGVNLFDGLNIAEPIDGPMMARYRSLAKKSGLWLSLGGFQQYLGTTWRGALRLSCLWADIADCGVQEVGPDPTHRYNSHIIVDSDGGVVSVYRKIHLFDLDMPDAGWLEVFDVAVYDNVCYVTGPEPIKLKESDATAPGAEVVACDSVAGRLGLT